MQKNHPQSVITSCGRNAKCLTPTIRSYKIKRKTRKLFLSTRAYVTFSDSLFSLLQLRLTDLPHYSLDRPPQGRAGAAGRLGAIHTYHSIMAPNTLLRSSSQGKQPSLLTDRLWGGHDYSHIDRHLATTGSKGKSEKSDSGLMVFLPPTAVWCMGMRIDHGR